MVFLMLPTIIVLFFLGARVQVWQLAQAVPGAGAPDYMEAAANVPAQQVLAFGAACVAAASAIPGLISVSIPPALSAGISTPVGAVCMVAARAGGGRDVYGYMLVAPSVAGFLIQNTQGNAAWLRASRQGTAVNMMIGVTYAVSTIIPAGVLIDWV